MGAEISALNENEISVLKEDISKKSIECKWVFKKKKDENGSVTKYKVRMVARGFP